tara:strand:- start:307 stop:636 length:330 start_codon:yes stop_codon:yes gene_type:complete
MIDELKNIKDRHRKRYGSLLPRVGTDEDVAWLIAEVDRLRNLKGVLMELGNRLVTDHGWWPPNPRWQAKDEEDHTGLIAGLTQQINDRPEMRELLNEFGFDWPIVEEDE